MDSAIDFFTDYLIAEKNYSPNTVKAYRTDLQQFVSFIERHEKNIAVPVSVEDITTDFIKSHIAYLYDIGNEASSIERKIAVIHSFFSVLHKKGYIQKNPSAAVNYPKKKKYLPVFMTQTQADEFVEVEADDFKSFRDRALFETFYSTGARVSELASADLVDIDLKAMRLKVLGKGGDERIVFLTPESSFYLEKYLSLREKKFSVKDTALFVNMHGRRITTRGIFHIVSKRSVKAGFNKSVTPHTLRHTFATEMMNGGADIRSVQELLGHKNISTTQVYTHTTRKKLIETYNKFHPHASDED